MFSFKRLLSPMETAYPPTLPLTGASNAAKKKCFGTRQAQETAVHLTRPRNLNSFERNGRQIPQTLCVRMCKAFCLESLENFGTYLFVM